MRTARLSVLALAALLVVAACGPTGPRAVHVGSDECAHCRMVVEDTRFAAQLLTDRGRSEVFDAIECLTGALSAGTYPEAEIHSLWVADFGEEGRWVPAGDAFFVHSPGIRSPMGAGLAAHAERSAAEAHMAEVGGHLMTWEQVRGIAPRGGGHAHHH
jgi:copper chaperone NosL